VVDADGNDVPVTVQSGATNTSIAATINTTNAALGAADVTVTSNEQESDPMSVSIVCAVPTAFAQASFYCASSTGVLSFTYAWASSTGNLADLATCQVGEVVSYPNGGVPSSPPFPNYTFNTPAIFGAATSGFFSDSHSPPSGSFVKPYSDNSFTATQNYKYECGCAGGDYNVLQTYSIVRQVVNPSATWMYQITKAGQSCGFALPQ